MRHSTPYVLGLLALASLALGSCISPKAPSSRTFLTPQTQIAHGADVYRRYCATCHGSNGEGSSRAPAVVGDGVLEDFDTALDVANFVVRNMPPSAKHKQELASHDYWAVLAFDLSANGVHLATVVTPEVAQGIRLH